MIPGPPVRACTRPRSAMLLATFSTGIVGGLAFGAVPALAVDEDIVSVDPIVATETEVSADGDAENAAVEISDTDTDLEEEAIDVPAEVDPSDASTDGESTEVPSEGESRGEDEEEELVFIICDGDEPLSPGPIESTTDEQIPPVDDDTDDQVPPVDDDTEDLPETSVNPSDETSTDVVEQTVEPIDSDDIDLSNMTTGPVEPDSNDSSSSHEPLADQAPSADDAHGESSSSTGGGNALADTGGLQVNQANTTPQAPGHSQSAPLAQTGQHGFGPAGLALASAAIGAGSLLARSRQGARHAEG